MFDEIILQKIYAHPKMKDIPVWFQNEVIQVIEEVLEDEARQYPFLYLAHTFQGNITENLKYEED